MGTLKHVDHDQRIYIQHEETNDVRVLGSKRLLSPSSWWRLQVSGDPSLKPSIMQKKKKKKKSVSICDSPCPHRARVHVNELIWLQGSLGNEEPPRTNRSGLGPCEDTRYRWQVVWEQDENKGGDNAGQLKTAVVLAMLPRLQPS